MFSGRDPAFSLSDQEISCRERRQRAHCGGRRLHSRSGDQRYNRLAEAATAKASSGSGRTRKSAWASAKATRPSRPIT